MSTSFQSLGLRDALCEAIAQIGFREMTPIQAKALPPMLEGRDVTGQAATGSGKTAAFGLAALQAIQPELQATQVLVLCPTRELAEQVATELRRLAQRLPNTRVLSVCGGQPTREQKVGLERGAQVVVGTPGRVGMHLSRQSLNLDELRVLVLDEADRMLDMGFIDQVSALVDACPRKRQTLLFSATFPEEIRGLSERIQDKALFVAVEAQVEPDQLQQLVFRCEQGQREKLVADLLAEYRPANTLVFCETRNDCDNMAGFLRKRGASALALHGQMDQRDRDDVLLQFSNGSTSVLVATNVAARGLDIPALPMVLIAELSPDPESHLHRIGRTGRAGESGLAVSIVSAPREHRRLEKIEEFLGQHIPRGEVPTCGGDLGFLKPTHRTLLLLSGRKDKLRKGDVLGALVKDGGIPAEAIGRLDLTQRICAVAIAREHAIQALRFVRSGRIKNRKIRARLLGDSP